MKKSPSTPNRSITALLALKVDHSPSRNRVPDSLWAAVTMSPSLARRVIRPCRYMFVESPLMRIATCVRSCVCPRSVSLSWLYWPGGTAMLMPAFVVSSATPCPITCGRLAICDCNVMSWLSRRASSVSTDSARIGSVPDEPPVSECNGWSPGASYGRPYTGVSGTSDHHQVVNVTDVVPHVADRRVRRPHRLDRVMLSDQLADGQRRTDHVWGRLGDDRARDHKPVPDQSGRSLAAHLTHVHIAARHWLIWWHVDEQHPADSEHDLQRRRLTVTLCLDQQSEPAAALHVLHRDGRCATGHLVHRAPVWVGDVVALVEHTE